MALLHFTSGTTGRPKGAVHVHEAVLAHAVTGRYALDLHDGDVFWCTADPGWVTGTSYGIIAPLVCGVTNVVVEAEFDPQTWYGVLERERITVWYTAPTAIRMMMKLGAEALQGVDLSALRFIASVGEPLNPEAVLWGCQGFRFAVPRQLVADRDRRHHDLQLRGHGHQARLDGQAACRGSPPRHRAPRGRRAVVELIDEPDVDGELALQNGAGRRCSAATCTRTSATEKCFVDALVPHRRPGAGATPTATTGSSAEPTT